MALALVIAALIGLPAAAQTKRKAPKTPRVLKVAKQQSFVAGGVGYAVQTIQSWQALPKVIGYEAPPPGSTFVVVNYTAETLSSDPVIVDANRFYLRDGKGRRFTVSDTAQTTLAFAPVNPGNEVELRPQMVLQPGVRRLLLAGFIVPEETAALGFFLYFPTSGDFDFVEVWPGGEPH